MTLSESNKLIIEYLAAGKRDKEIARLLCLAPRTIEHRIAGMMNEYQCRTRTQLVVMFVKEWVMAEKNGKT